ncbi:hypothetical protein MMC09_004116 [Bachmanniomyces sp. S44760]|nr:hypothetical protein [Bachmanniomyces sp. S44760]
MLLPKTLLAAFGMVLVFSSTTVVATQASQPVFGPGNLNELKERDVASNGTVNNSIMSNATINGTEIASDPVDITDLDSESQQAPLVPGLIATSPILQSYPAIQPVVAPAGSDLTSRDMTADVIYTADNGSMILYNKNVTYPVAVGKAVMQSFFLSARNQSLQKWQAGEVGDEPNHDYFRYTAGGLSMVAIAYGAGGSGGDPFNWGDYSQIVEWLYNLTLTEFSDNDNTFSGNVLLADGTPTVDYVVTTSFGDVVGAGQPKTSNPTTTSGAATLSNPQGGEGGRRRLAKRQRTSQLGGGIVLKTRRAVAVVSYRILAQVLIKACSDAVMDSSVSPTYLQYTAQELPPLVPANSPENLIQFISPTGGLDKATYIKWLSKLRSRSVIDQWYGKNLYGPALFGEIINEVGDIVAQWSLGIALTQVAPCFIKNPDGSYALGCFIRDEL